MIEGKAYKGIEYIQISDLPSSEQIAIREWLTLDTIIKIHTDKELLTDCVQFKDYKYWFENILASSTSEEIALTRKVNPIKPFGFAIDN
jgi:hypothetical protein